MQTATKDDVERLIKMMRDAIAWMAQIPYDSDAMFETFQTDMAEIAYSHPGLGIAWNEQQEDADNDDDTEDRFWDAIRDRIAKQS